MQTWAFIPSETFLEWLYLVDQVSYIAVIVHSVRMSFTLYFISASGYRKQAT